MLYHMIKTEAPKAVLGKKIVLFDTKNMEQIKSLTNIIFLVSPSPYFSITKETEIV